MDPKVASMMKGMNFFLIMGLGKHSKGLRTIPEMKGQLTRFGLGYECKEEERDD